MGKQSAASIEYLYNPTKKQKRKRKTQQSGLTLQEIEPLTDSQAEVFKAYNQGFNLTLTGCAGTGKTMLSMYLALRDILQKRDEKTRLIIVRSAVASRDIGFLPGNVKEKTKQYEQPYIDLCTFLFGRGDAYEILKTKKIIDFKLTSYVRGETWDDAIILVDEFQNMKFQEQNSVITRVGENSRIVFSGDDRQDDLTSKRYNEESGMEQFMSILDRMPSFSKIDFQIADIVRSGIVKEYLEAYYK